MGCGWNIVISVLSVIVVAGSTLLWEAFCKHIGLTEYLGNDPRIIRLLGGLIVLGIVLLVNIILKKR